MRLVDNIYALSACILCVYYLYMDKSHRYIYSYIILVFICICTMIYVYKFYIYYRYMMNIDHNNNDSVRYRDNSTYRDRYSNDRYNMKHNKFDDETTKDRSHNIISYNDSKDVAEMYLKEYRKKFLANNSNNNTSINSKYDHTPHTYLHNNIILHNHTAKNNGLNTNMYTTNDRSISNDRGISLDNNNSSKVSHLVNPSLFYDIPASNDNVYPPVYNIQGRRLFNYTSSALSDRNNNMNNRQRSDSYTYNNRSDIHNTNNNDSSMRYTSNSPLRYNNKSDIHHNNNRSILKKSTVMIKESVSRYSSHNGNQPIHNDSIQSTRELALETLKDMGGDISTYNRSIDILQSWISKHLLNKYYDDNRKNIVNISSLLLPFRKTLYENDMMNNIDIRHDKDNNRILESISIDRLMTIYTSSGYDYNKWIVYLGSCTISNKDEIDRLNRDIDREMRERSRLDLYIRILGYSPSDIRYYVLQRVRILRGVDRISQYMIHDNNTKDNQPSDDDIILFLFANYVMDVHPSLSMAKDYESIFLNRIVSRVDNTVTRSIFKIKKENSSKNVFCVYNDKYIHCFVGDNNAFSACLYLAHYILTDRTDGEAMIEMQKKNDTKNLLMILKNCNITQHP